jgi:hypothetical protein
MDGPLRAAPTAWPFGQSGSVPERRVQLRPNQRPLPVPSRPASSSLFVFSDAWLEEDQLPQQPSLLRLRDPVAMHGQSIPLRVPSRERSRIGPNAGPNSAAPRHPRPSPRDRRAPVWHDQAMDEPGCVSDAGMGEGSRRIQSHCARLQSPARSQFMAFPDLIAGLQA